MQRFGFVRLINENDFQQLENMQIPFTLQEMNNATALALHFSPMCNAFPVWQRHFARLRRNPLSLQECLTHRSSSGAYS